MAFDTMVRNLVYVGKASSDDTRAHHRMTVMM